MLKFLFYFAAVSNRRANKLKRLLAKAANMQVMIEGDRGDRGRGGRDGGGGGHGGGSRGITIR
jgi:hypothetical protein